MDCHLSTPLFDWDVICAFSLAPSLVTVVNCKYNVNRVRKATSSITLNICKKDLIIWNKYYMGSVILKISCYLFHVPIIVKEERKLYYGSY